MRDLMLLIILIILFLFGWYVMKRLDRFIDENQTITKNHSTHKKCEITVAAPRRRYLSYFTEIIKNFLKENTYLELLYGNASGDGAFAKLSKGDADIALVSEDSLSEMPKGYDYVIIPPELYALNHKRPAFLHGHGRVCAVWDSLHESVSRDRVIWALKNEVNTELRGYCDYK